MNSAFCFSRPSFKRSLTSVCIALLAFLSASVASAAPGEPDDSLTYFGARPLYNNGAKVNVIVDDFGWIDQYRPAAEVEEITAAIEEWNAAGIEYAAYFALGLIESEDAIAALGDSGRTMDLDGSYNSYFMWTRSAFVDYFLDAGKAAIDAGATYFIIDNGAPGLPVLSFDDEIVESFRVYLAANYTTGELSAMGVSDVSTFNYRDYLKSPAGGSYTDSDSVQSSYPGDALWSAWLTHLETEEREFYATWVSTLRTYAQSTYSKDVYLCANRGHAKAWKTADLFDFTMSETFLDSLGYPYYNLDDHFKTSLNLGKRFWSWNFPANTGSMNGSNDPYGHLKITQLSKVFAAETLAAGGLYQLPIDWVSYTRDDERLNTILGPTVRFSRVHPELFNLDVAGEVAVIYNEAYELDSWADYRPGFQGIMALLGDSHISYDVIVAAAPDRRDGSDPLLTTDLSTYKAIVLNKTRYLSDAQVTALETYVNGGGVVVGLSQVADLDENGDAAGSGRTFDNNFGSDATTTVGSGRIISIASDLGDNYHGSLATNGPGEFDWTQTAQNLTDQATHRTSYDSSVGAYIENDFQTSLGTKVRTHRYVDSDGSLVYHLVNRDISLPSDVTTQSITSTSAVSSSVAIPDGFDSSTAKLSWMSVASPDPVDLSFSVSSGRLVFTLPAFELWGVLKVGSVAESSEVVDETPEANIDLFTAGAGHRPDKVDTEGDLLYPYYYWKGGNHESAPWAVPFFASDDVDLSEVKLYYRYSSDNSTWGSWAYHSSESVSGENVEGDFTFEGPDGEGYYEFRVQAVDITFQSEVVTDRDEVGYGYDETAPGEPSNGAAAGFEDGAWIEDLTGLTVTWDLPTDNLSGLNAAHIMLVTDSATVDSDDLDETDQSWTPDLAGLVAGKRHTVIYRAEDHAGNWNSYTEIFSFSYGALPVADLENVAVSEGDAKLTVSWTVPSDENYHHAAVSYRVNETGAAWQSAGNSVSEVATSLDIEGLTNGVEYQVRVNSVSNDSKDGNILVVSGTYTPTEGAGGGGSTTVAAPSGLALEDNTANVRLTWVDNSDNETGFRIERRKSGDAGWTTVATIGAGAQAFVDNINIGLDTYEYRVKATGASEDSEYTSAEQISRSGGGGEPGGGDPGPGPGDSITAPASLSAVDGTTNVQLSWDDLSNNETGFEIERRQQGDLSWSTVTTAAPNATSFQDNLDIGSDTYEYRVRAVNGGSQSSYSNVASVTRSGGGGEPGGGDPGPGPGDSITAPASLSAVDGTTNVQLSWDDLSNNETGFEIERRIQGDLSWSTVTTAAPNATSFQDNLDIGSDTYEYRVRAVNGGSQSSYSNVASVTRSGGGGEPGGGDPGPGPGDSITAPASLSAVDGTTNVQLSWDDLSNNETGFEIERRQQGDLSWSTVTTAAPNATSFQDNLDIGSDTYEYRVRAVNGGSQSSYSNVASVTRSGGGGEPGGGDPGPGETTPPAAPNGVTAVDGGTYVTVSWTDNSSDETGFAIMRRVQGTDTWFSAGTAEANAITFQDDIDIGTDTYEYQVSAEKGEVASAFSAATTVSRESGGEGGGEETPPAAPSSLAAADQGTYVLISWTDNSSDETGFSIVRRIQGTDTWLAAGTTAANATSYQDDIDIGSVVYEYRVAADKGSVASDFTTAVTVSRSLSGGDTLALEAIITGDLPDTISISDSETVSDLEAAVRTHFGLAGETLEIYLGETLLANGELALSEAGFANGNQFTVIVDGSENCYAAWQLEVFGSEKTGRLPTEDPNHDGVANLAHYAFGTDPTGVFESNRYPQIRFSGDNRIVEYYSNPDASEATIKVVVSTDEGDTWVLAEQAGLNHTTVGEAENGLDYISWSWFGIEKDWDSVLVDVSVEFAIE